jgi:hypothetical protein
MVRTMICASAGALVFALALGVSEPVFSQGNPFGALRIGANRSAFTGKCPVSVIFTGNIKLNMPHPQGFTFNYSWVRSDGAKGPVNVVHPGPNERMLVVKEPWEVGAAGHHYDLSVTLHVNSGNTHLQEQSQVVSVNCK